MFEETKRFTDADGVFSYIEEFTNLERSGYRPRQYRLERMNRLLSVFGNPHHGFNIVHVAGSKGKGSTATFIAAVLREAGYETGLYMSPHVSDYRERITRAGDFLDDDVFVGEAERIAAYVSRLDSTGLPVAEYPTTFELLTLLAFLVFRRMEFPWIVVEVGIGGRLDATNVVVPKAAVITPIELEHTDYLGNTIEEIAAEKAGIVKPRVPVFVGRLAEPAMEVVRTVAADRASEIHELAVEAADVRASVTRTGTSARVAWRSSEVLDLDLALIGRAQVDNACLAALVCRHLLPELSREVVARGLSSARLPGRMEVIHRRATVVLDGAHTPESVRATLSSFEEAFGRGATLVFGAVSGKRHEEMASILASAFSRIIVTTPGTFKESDPASVAEVFRRLNAVTTLVPDPVEAVATAEAGSEAVLVTGSFYLVGAVRRDLLDASDP